jgi:hypothetical protein
MTVTDEPTRLTGVSMLVAVTITGARVFGSSTASAAGSADSSFADSPLAAARVVQPVSSSAKTVGETNKRAAIQIAGILFRFFKLLMLLLLTLGRVSVWPSGKVS